MTYLWYFHFHSPNYFSFLKILPTFQLSDLTFSRFEKRFSNPSHPSRPGRRDSIWPLASLNMKNGYEVTP